MDLIRKSQARNMKFKITKALLVPGLMLLSNELMAQSSGFGMNIFIYIILAVAVLLFFGLIVQVSDSMLAIEARQIGADRKGANFGIFPRMSEIFAKRLPEYISEGEQVTQLSRGHDILLEGVAEKKIKHVEVSTFAIQPPNFIGISPIPKMVPDVGSEVKAGDVLFYDKKRPEIKYVSPVSGEIIAVNRGEKRAITEVVILADKKQKFKEYEKFDVDNNSREALVAYLLESGAWPLIRQRPFNVVADPSKTPRDIFISTFDTAPIAPDLNFVVEGRGKDFQKGLDVLAKLTDGQVYLGMNASEEEAPSEVFTNATGVVKHWFMGKHPAGNVGVQIHHINPIASGDTVWTLGVQEVLTLGALFNEQKYRAERVIAVAGAELKEPAYVKTYQGAKIADLVKGNLIRELEKVRLISGGVLSGEKKSNEQFLNFYDSKVTAIEEGNYFEMFGWLIPIKARPSISRTFPNFLFPDLTFKGDTNTHGEERAFVVTGEYEKVLPMDVYVMQLMKSIMINDFEKMEGLGIYELVEEDVALCEFVCISKQPLQALLRQGLDVMREQS